MSADVAAAVLLIAVPIAFNLAFIALGRAGCTQPTGSGFASPALWLSR